MKLEFSRQMFFKNARLTIFAKIRPVGTQLLRADRQTDLTKYIVVFRNFANAPKGDITGLSSRPCV